MLSQFLFICNCYHHFPYFISRWYHKYLFWVIKSQLLTLFHWEIYYLIKVRFETNLFCYICVQFFYKDHKQTLVVFLTSENKSYSLSCQKVVIVSWFVTQLGDMGNVKYQIYSAMTVLIRLNLIPLIFFLIIQLFNSCERHHGSLHNQLMDYINI